MKPFIGLIGILIAAVTAELNDQVASIALVDARGALGISYDPGSWIESLYSSAQIAGLCFLSLADTLVILGALTLVLTVIVVLLPARTLPPRIQSANQ